MLATPNGNIFWSSDNAIISQLFNAWPRCGVPLEIVQFFDIWGPTLGSVEGDDWKAHRRVVTAGFNNSIHTTVWKATQIQVSAMTERWQEDHGAVVPVVCTWTCRLALHIVSYGPFNKSLSWDDESMDRSMAAAQGQKHAIRFDQALRLMLKQLAIVYIVPQALLKRLPFQKVREANLALNEVTEYFKEIQAGAEVDLETLAKKRHKSLLEFIVLSGSSPEVTGKTALPNVSVMGNTFFTLLAGHETVGSTMGSTFLLMAIYPDIQAKVQEQLDRQLGDRPRAEWTVQKDYQALQQGYLGAVQK